MDGGKLMPKFKVTLYFSTYANIEVDIPQDSEEVALNEATKRLNYPEAFNNFSIDEFIDECSSNLDRWKDCDTVTKMED